MIMRNRLSVLLIMASVVVAVAATSCKGETDNSTGDAAKADFAAEKNIVDTMRLIKRDFYREVISNGTLVGTSRAELKFVSQGEIAKVYVKNGSYVRKGDPIAQLSTKSMELATEKADQNLEKARLDLYDKLIGYGYGSDTSKVPAEQLKMAKIRSGYNSAEYDRNVAYYNMDNATLRAPFSGIVANLKAKPYEQSKDNICLIIDNSSFDVAFNLLESEISYISVGQIIRVSPFVDLSAEYSGRIKEINPYVDEKGQIKVVASVTNKGGKLIEGMNVKVFIESSRTKQLVVPKSAVVIRDGYDVIFTLNTATNKAQWVYVDVLQSNSTHHVICGCKKKSTILNEGETVIISGNLNLADGSNVEIRN